MCVCVCLYVRPPVCLLCVGMLQHPCLRMCLFVRLSAGGVRTEGMRKRMVISVSRGLARGSMIKTLNQTPCSNITAESCNFNVFRPVDTGKSDVNPFNINQPLQETPGWSRTCLGDENSSYANVARSCNFSPSFTA